MTAMDSLASDSCHTLSDTDIETISQEELVIFDTVQTCYSNQKDLIVLYTSGTAVEHSRSHWIGIFKKGWQTTSDYSLHQWVPFDPISIWQPRRRRTIFPQADVSKLSGSFQFLYVAGKEQVLGVSGTFQISDKELPSGSTLHNHPPQSLSLHNLELSSSSSSSSEDHEHGEDKVNKIKSLSDHTLAQTTNSSFKSNAFSSLQDSTTLSDFHLPLNKNGFYQKLKFVTHENEVKAGSNYEDLNYLNLSSPSPQCSKLIQELENKLQSNSIIFSPNEQKAFTKAIHFHPYQRLHQSLALSMCRENLRSLRLEVYRNSLPESNFSSFNPFKSLTTFDVNKLKVWKTASTNDIKEDIPGSISNVISKIQGSPPNSSQASEAERKYGDTDEVSSDCSVLEKKSQNVCKIVLRVKKMPSENDERERCTTASRSLKNFTFSFRGNEMSKALVPTWPKNDILPLSDVEKHTVKTSADPCVNAPEDQACIGNHSFATTATTVYPHLPDQTGTFLAVAGSSTNGSNIEAKFQGESSFRVSPPRKRLGPVLNVKASIAKKRRLSQVKLSGTRLHVGSMADTSASDLSCTCFSGEATGQLAEMTERIALLDTALLEALKENADLRGKLLCMEEKMQKMNQDGCADKATLNTNIKERKSSRRSRATSEKQTTRKTTTITKDDVETQELSNRPQTTHPSSQESNDQNCRAKVADAKVTLSAPRSRGRGPNSGQPESWRQCVGVKKGASKLSGVTDGSERKITEKMLPDTCADVNVCTDKVVNTSSVAVKSDRKPQKALRDQEDNHCYCHPDKASSSVVSSSKEEHTPEKWDVVSSKRMVRLKRLVARKKEEFAQLRDSVEKAKQHVEVLQAQLRAVRTTLSFETRRRLTTEKDLNVIRIRFWELISARKWQGWGAFNSSNVMLSSARSLRIFGDVQEREPLGHLKALPWKNEKGKQNEPKKADRFSGWYARKKENVQTTTGGTKLSGASADKSLADDIIGEDEEVEMENSIRDLRRSVTFKQFLLPHEAIASAEHGIKNKDVKANAAAAIKSADTPSVCQPRTRPSSRHSSLFKSKQALLKGRMKVTRKRKESNIGALENESVTSSPQQTRRQAVRGQSLLGPDHETKAQRPESDEASDSGVDDVLDEDSNNWSPPPVSVQLQGARSSVVVVGAPNNSSLLDRPSGALLAKRGRYSSLVKFTHNDLRPPGQRSALGVLSGASSQPPPDVVLSATPLGSLVGCGNSCFGGRPDAGQVANPRRPGNANRFLPQVDVDQQQQRRASKPRALHFEYDDKVHNHSLNRQIGLDRCLTSGISFSQTLARLLAEEHIHPHHAFTEIDESKVEAFRKSAVPILPEFEGFCPDKPCVHGKCVEGGNGILTCHCQKGFTGQKCDINLEKRSANELVVRLPVEAARTAEIATASVISVLLLLGTIFMLYFLVSSRRRQQALKEYLKQRGRLHPQAGNNFSNNNPAGQAPEKKSSGGLCSCCPCCRATEKKIEGKEPLSAGGGTDSGGSESGETGGKKDKKGKDKKGKDKKGKDKKKGGKEKKDKKKKDGKKKRSSKKGRNMTSDRAPLLGEDRNQQCLYHSSNRSPTTRISRDGHKNHNVSSSHTRRSDHHDCLCHLGKEPNDYDWERAYRAVRSSRYSHLNISQNHHSEEASPAPQQLCLTLPSTSLRTPAASARLGTKPDDFDGEFSKILSKMSTLSGQGGPEPPTGSTCWQSDSDESPLGCQSECRPLLQGNSTHSERGDPVSRPELGDDGYGKFLSTSVPRAVDSNYWEQPLAAPITGGDETLKSAANRTPKIDEKKAIVKCKLADHAPWIDTLLPSPAGDEESRLLATMQWCADQNDRLLRYIDSNRKRLLVTAHSRHDNSVLPPIHPQKKDPRCEQAQPKNHDNVVSHGVSSKTGAGTTKMMTTHPPSRRTVQGKEVRWHDSTSPGVPRPRNTMLGRSRIKLGFMSKATPLDDKSPYESKPLDATMMPARRALPLHLFPYSSSDHMHLGACSPFLHVVHSNQRSQEADCFLSRRRKNAVETVPGSQAESFSFNQVFSTQTSDYVREDGWENASSAGHLPKAPLRCTSSGHDAPPGINEPKSKKRQELSTSILPRPRVDGAVTLDQAERALGTEHICVDSKRCYAVKDSSTEPISQTIKTQDWLDLSTIPLVWSLKENKGARSTEPEVNWGRDQSLHNTFGPFLSTKTSDRVRQDAKKELKPANAATKLAQSEVPENHSANTEVSRLLKSQLNGQINEEACTLQAQWHQQGLEESTPATRKGRVRRALFVC